MENRKTYEDSTRFISEIGNPTWDILREAIGNNDINGMRLGMKRLLDLVSGESLLTQLVLVDETGTVLFPLLTSSHHWDDMLKGKIDLAEVNLYGERWESGTTWNWLNAHLELDGHLIACKKLDESDEVQRNLKNENDSPRYFDLYNLQKINGNPNKKQQPFRRNFSMLTQLEGISIPDVMDSSSFFERFVIGLFRLPTTKNTPAITGYLTFALKSKGDFHSQVYDLQDKLLWISYLVKSIACVFQSVAVLFASAQEPRRFWKELSASAWVNLFKKEIIKLDDTKNETNIHSGVNLLLNSLLKTIDSQTTRRVLRKVMLIGRGKPAFQELIRSFWESALKQKESKQLLHLSAVEHLDIILPLIITDENSSEWVNENILSMISPPPISTANLEEMRGHTSTIGNYSLFLSVLDTLYPMVDAPLQETIQSVLIELADVAEGDAQLERMIASLILFSKYTNDAQLTIKINRRIVDGLIKLSKNNKTFQLVDLLFAQMDSDWRLKILLDLNVKDPSSSFLAHQLISIHNRLDKYDVGEEIRAKIFAKENGNPRTDIISVISAKGGVGKSLIALGLASLAKSKTSPDARVCIVDLDFFGPTLDRVITHSNVGKSLTLNEYLWVKILPKISEDERTKIFEGKQAWEKYFTELSSEGDETLLQYLLQSEMNGAKNEDANLDFITCSTDHYLQDLMLPLLMSGKAIEPIKSELRELSLMLHNAGYQYIIFDTPAELRELAAVAASLSTQYGGKNVFVSTLLAPALSPLLSLLPMYYNRGKNYLIINKIRRLDVEFVKDKGSFIEYLISMAKNNISNYHVSSPLVDFLLCVEPKGIRYIPWSEDLELFMNRPGITQNELCNIKKATQHALNEILLN